MISTIVAGIVALLLLVLLLPIRYDFSLKKWEIALSVSVFLGLWKKEISFDLDDDEEEEAIDDSLLSDMLQKAEEAHSKQTEEERQETNISHGAKHFLESHEEEDTDHPSHMEQLRFALHNGLLEKLLHALACCLSHGWPKRWDIQGEFGTGDPMETGILCGMTAAFLPKETSGIVWNYLDKVMNLSGKAQGRIIPLYVIYIVLKIIVSKEARQFWHFRQGGTQHE